LLSLTARSANGHNAPFRKRSNEEKRSAAGFMFVLPWFIGILIFFIQPIINLIRYSVTKLQFVEGAGIVLNKLPEGIFEHFRYAFASDEKFPRIFTSSILDMMYQLPVIVIFAMFTAIVLNQKFKGRIVMRTVFFLPVIVTAGVISVLIKTSMTSVVMSSGESSNIFNAALLIESLNRAGLPSQIVDTVGAIVSNVSDLVWSSGVQILVFLMGLHTIPTTYYEVAQVEGATGWETFWKIVFPVISPYILVNMVYTVVDCLVRYDNSVMRYITEVAYDQFNYSYAAAMSWVYFIAILAIVSIIFGLVTKLLLGQKGR